MKPIRILNDATQGLKDYLMGQPPNLTWTRFQNQDGTSAREIRIALVQLQHGLCGYCEQMVTIDDSQVEHVIPRSTDINGNGHELDHTNMIACCKGGSAVNIYGPNTNQHDPDRVGDESCGQAKRDIQDELLLDPRNLPILRSLFTVRSNGKITPDPEACLRAGISEESVNRTIAVLGLDVGRLQRARSKRWAFINEKYADDLDNEYAMKQAAKAELLPDKAGTLPRFFSTNRSYFGPYADPILAAGDATWV